MIENGPLITIVMPAYNEEKTIGRAIKSLYFQTYKNWKCIIINDCSTDNTKSHLHSLTDSRFEVIHLEKNMGRAFSRQVGLDNAVGEYLAMLDADDFYHPRKLEIQIQYMESNPEVSLLGCGMCSFGDAVPFIRLRGMGNGEVLKFNKKDKFNITHAPSLLRLEHAKKYKYNVSLKYSEDVDFLSRFLEGRSYMIIKDILYYYSEFDSTSVSKIIKGYYYCIIKGMDTLSTQPLFAVKYLITNVAKLIIGILTYPIIGIKNILKRRGVQPSIEEQKQFDSLFSKLN